MLLRSTLLAAALAALSAAPAPAQTPPGLDPLKPCYVVANENQREFVPVIGHGFTPFAFVDIYVDEIAGDIVGQRPQVDVERRHSPGPCRRRSSTSGQRPFTLRAAERG